MKVVIVGKGTAGLLTAAWFNSLKDVKVTLVSSEDIPTIGVGEGTTPIINEVMNLIGGGDYPKNPDPLIYNWHKQDLDNTPKYGIKYSKWTKKGEDWTHGFSGHVSWHLSSSRFCVYLEKICISKGVEFIDGRIDNVMRSNEDGWIESLSCSNGEKIEADFFIDCSGLGRVLRKEAETVDFSTYLPCDQAIATHVGPSAEDKQQITYTTATALSNGWSWRIPLQSSAGVGYAYSSKFTTEDKALEEFESFLGEKVKTPLRISFEPTVLKELMYGNCLSLGLSAGFLEPMEATNIWNIAISLMDLNKNMLDRRFSRGLINQYNDKALLRNTEFVRYISAHYKFSDRDDSDFWKYVVNDMPAMEDLQFIDSDALFPINSWDMLRKGMGVV